MAFIPNKPSHRAFVLRDLNETQYKKYAQQYSRAKAGGLRCVYVWASGTGLLGIVKDLSKGMIIDYSKRKFAFFFVGACTYFGSPGVVWLTNASNIINISKSVHSAISFCFECVEDSSNLSFAPLDLVIFGQLIPIGASNRFNFFRNTTDFMDV